MTERKKANSKTKPTKPAEAAAARVSKAPAAPRATKAPATAARISKAPAAPRNAAGSGSKRGKNLVIVESPAKARTIGKYLGPGFEVRASNGHVRDLPKSKLGVDIEHGFQPSYILIKGKAKILKELKQSAKQAATIYLAPDPDREGEAIAWHLAETLGKDRKSTRLNSSH